MVQTLRAPLFVQLELTEGCNYNCGYCSNPFSNSRGARPTPEEVGVYLEELISNKVFSVVLTGGEPFTNRPALYHSIDRMADESLEMHLNTNLSIPLNERDLQRLRKLEHILVSFPSYDEERFQQVVEAKTYRQVINNLEVLAAEKIPFSINQVVTPVNYEDVYDTAIFLHENFGLMDFSASPVIPGCSTEVDSHSISKLKVRELAELLVRIEQKKGIKTDMLTFIPPCYFPENISNHRLAAHGCSANRDSLIIGATGDIRRCALLPETYGNLKTESLRGIWSRITSLKKSHNPICDGCMPQEFCYGGCEARCRHHEGADQFIVGLSEERRKKIYHIPGDSLILKMGRVLWREEGDKFLVGHGGSYVTGNKELLEFIRRIEGRSFTLGDITAEIGLPGANLITYLYNRGLIKCDSQ